MRRPKRGVVIVMAAAIVATLWAGTMVVAGNGAPPVVTGNGFDVTRLKVVSSTGGQDTGSSSFVDLVGASRSIQLTQSSLVLARFTAESTCFEEGDGSPQSSPNGGVSSSDPDGVCRVRIIAKKAPSTVVELNPASGENYSFDELECCTQFNNSEGHALERYATLGPGTWEIQVQYAVSQVKGLNGNFVFILDDWNLAVERWLVS